MLACLFPSSTHIVSSSFGSFGSYSTWTYAQNGSVHRRDYLFGPLLPLTHPTIGQQA